MLYWYDTLPKKRFPDCDLDLTNRTCIYWEKSSLNTQWRDMKKKHFGILGVWGIWCKDQNNIFCRQIFQIRRMVVVWALVRRNWTCSYGRQKVDQRNEPLWVIFSEISKFQGFEGTSLKNSFLNQKTFVLGLGIWNKDNNKQLLISIFFYKKNVFQWQRYGSNETCRPAEIRIWIAIRI